MDSSNTKFMVYLPFSKILKVTSGSYLEWIFIYTQICLLYILNLGIFRVLYHEILKDILDSFSIRYINNPILR